ncbi:uncharacterized protein LOC144925115 isoform X2 [Branchiostoma floridae x Branchiostoma belcheri]
MVRIYVRNKGRYDPKTAENPLPFVDVDNPGDVLIKHVREVRILEETVKRRINCKLDELYYNNQLLDEDRSVAYSNLQDGTVLESCSNPFWAACMYVRLRAVEQEAANNPTDQKKQRWTHQSILNRAAALGVLFNSNSFERHQPPHLPTLQDLWTCLQTNGRKPVHMSEITQTALQELQEEFQNIDVHRRDPLASFVHRHAVKLGFRDPNAPEPGDGPVHAGPGNGVPGTQAAGARGNNNNRNGGRRRQNRPRPCDDCEAEDATKYCAQCEGGLVLCQPCCDRLHQGRARRHHNIQGIEEAPKAAKSYTPKAYKAPFAMLVALFKGLSQVPQVMSMTADEIKSRAQVFTDTDLSDRAAGKFFGGFDNMQNTLQINGFVQREAGENARFSLLQPGRTLAQKCTEFHQAVEDLLNVNRVPKVPQLGGTQCGSRRVCLLVDSKEPLCERMAALAHRQGVAAQVRDLPVGDFLWILLPPAAGVDYAAVRPDDEQVLPHIVERKTWDDLQNSLSTRRFRNQVEAMKRCGLRDLFYLVEGHPSDMRTRPSKEQIQYYENQLLNLEMKDGFLVNRTGTWLKTAQWLLQLTAMAAHMQNTGTNGRLITYAEYSTRASSKNRGVPEPRPRTDYLGVHTWSADKLVDMVFRQYHNEANFSDAAKTDLQDVLPTQRSPGSRPLLIIQDLEVYNKNSQKFKDRALAEYLNQQAGNRTVREIVDTMLGASVRELIHFDVFCYWQLWLQVHLGCHVKRTEAQEETQRLQNLYRQHRNDTGPNQPLFFDNFLNHNGGDDDDDDDDDDDGRGRAPPVQRGRGRRAQGRGRGRGNNRRGTVRPQLPPNNRRVAGSATAGRRKPSQGRKQDHPSNDPPMPTLGPDVAGTVNEGMEVDEGRRLGSLSTDDFAPDSQNEDLMIQQALELSKADSLPAARKTNVEDRTKADFASDSQNEDLMIQHALELSKADSLPAARNDNDEDRTKDDFASDSQNEDLMIQQALELSKADSLPAARNDSDEDRREDANRDEEHQLAEALRLSLVEHEKQTSAMQEHGAIPEKPQDFSENISNDIVKQQDFKNIATDESLDETEPIEIIDSQDVNETIPETEGSSHKDASLDEPIEIIDSQDTVVEENDVPLEVSDDLQNTSIEAVKDTGADNLTRSSSDTQEEESLPAVSAKKDSLLPKESNSEKTLYSSKRDISPRNSFTVENGNTHKSAVGTESDVSNPTSSEKSSDFMQSNREEEARLEEMQQRSEEDKTSPGGMPQDTTMESENSQDAMPFELDDKMLTNSSTESSSDSKEKEDSSAENVDIDPDLALAIRLSQEEAKMARKRYGQVDKRVTRSKAKSSPSCSSATATQTPDKADSSALKKVDGPTLETQTSAAREEIDPDLALALKLSEEEFVASQKKDEQMIREKSLKGKPRNNDTGTDGKVLESFSKNKTHDRNASGQNNSNSPRAILNDQVLPDVQQKDEPFSFVENSVKEEEFVEENFGPVLQSSRHDRDSPEDNEIKLKELAASLSGNTNTRDLQESLQDSQDFETQIEDIDKDLCLALKLSEKEISSTTTIAGICERKSLPTKQTSQKDNNLNQDLQKDFELAVRVAFQEKMDCEDHSCSKLKEIDTCRVKEEEIVEQNGSDKDLELAKKLHEDLNRDVLQSEHKTSTEAVKVLGGVQSSTTKRKLDLHYEKDLELAKQLEAELNRKPADVENSAKRIKVDPDYEKDLALARQLERDKISSQTQYEKDLELARKLSEELNSDGSGSKKNSSGFGSPSSKRKLPDTSGSPGTSEGPAVFRGRRREREKSAQQLEDYRRLQAQHYRTSAVGATASTKSTPASTPQRQSQHATGRSAAEIFTMDDDDDLPDIPPGIQLHDANPGTSNATRTPQTHVRPSSSSASASRPSTSDGMSSSDGGDTGTCNGTSTSTADGTPGTSTPRQNTKCGACGQQGHNRTSKRCPRYFCQEEVNRRQAQAERRQAKAEAEERDFRSKLGRLEREREESARVRSQLRRQFEEMDRRMREREEDAQAVIQHLDKGRKKRKK